ncbi:MAG: hypothetical protein OER43_19710 [Gammaproteobacteria bacterium]|nr:hypothetical protein [Gammaproteobacteria bacterium]
MYQADWQEEEDEHRNPHQHETSGVDRRAKLTLNRAAIRIHPANKSRGKVVTPTRTCSANCDPIFRCVTDEPITEEVVEGSTVHGRVEIMEDQGRGTEEWNGDLLPRKELHNFPTPVWRLTVSA